VTTSYGESIFLVGSIPQLGNWNTGNAVPLSASGYTSTNPVWSVTVNLPVGTSFQYKYLRKNQDGSVVWESDPNRSYSVGSSCAGAEASASDSWR
jgi:1,4-alpha-glucan branching enzyme